MLDCCPRWLIAAPSLLPPSLPVPLFDHTHALHTLLTGFLSFSLPFDFIYCSRSVLIYLCCLTSHSDNLLSALSALQPSLLSLSNLAPISVFLMASFEVRTAVIFIFCANICKLITSELGLVGSTLACVEQVFLKCRIYSHERGSSIIVVSSFWMNSCGSYKLTS